PTASGSACPTVAVWRDLLVEGASATHSDPAGDIPITDLVRDDLTGDLYAATDFGVLRNAGGVGAPAVAWTEAGVNLPRVEVPGLTIDPCSRILYAATHGRSVWRMFLPPVAAAKNRKGCPRTRGGHATAGRAWATMGLPAVTCRGRIRRNRRRSCCSSGRRRSTPRCPAAPAPRWRGRRSRSAAGRARRDRWPPPP